MNVKSRNNRKLLKIGNEIIEGPSAIFRISDGDWLESDLTITLKNSDYSLIESYSIFTDDTMNQEEPFLPPMIRIVKWERSKDHEKLNNDKTHDFPTINAELGVIKKEKFKKLNMEFISIQELLIKRNNYIPFKINLNRGYADVKTNPEKEVITFSINFRNGSQRFEFSSTGTEGNEIFDKIIKMKELLMSSIEPIDKTNWKEIYYNLTNDYLEGNIPEWNYGKSLNY